ncbi:hypothetical protein [Gordonia soli]|uniref:Uncharacterized protein n=1 Tax=Gordonia soli NBRC 108243 TaxID=1223545 RepID=M0QRY6_9ACTN|nr:hypothetical protein [Gordonia soli]GAC70512.1 hypothetical protein GS4_35_00880 [Gordonia soli NBRC 108243]
MTTAADPIADLRDRAVAGVEHLADVLGLGATLGLDVPTADEIRAGFRAVGRVGLPAMAADGERLQAAVRAVGEHLDRLPEQEIRIGQAWAGAAGAAALARIAEHRHATESDAQVLRTLADSTTAAAAGIDRLVRAWYLAVARLTTPVIADHPLPAVPAAVATGAVPLSVVADDIAARIHLFTTTSSAAATGITEILQALDRAVDGLDQPTTRDAQVRQVRGVEPSTNSVETGRTYAEPDRRSGGGSGGGQPSDGPVPGSDLPLRLSNPGAPTVESSTAYVPAPYVPAPYVPAPDVPADGRTDAAASSADEGTVDERLTGDRVPGAERAGAGAGGDGSDGNGPDGRERPGTHRQAPNEHAEETRLDVGRSGIGAAGTASAPTPGTASPGTASPNTGSPGTDSPDRAVPDTDAPDSDTRDGDTVPDGTSTLRGDDAAGAGAGEQRTDEKRTDERGSGERGAGEHEPSGTSGRSGHSGSGGDLALAGDE